MTEFCVGCKYNGENVGEFVWLNNYLLNKQAADGDVKLVKYTRVKVPICLLLAAMRKKGVDESRWPSMAEIAVHFDSQHHGPTGTSPIGNDVIGTCTGRNR